MKCEKGLVQNMEIFRVKITESTYEDMRAIINHVAYKLRNPQAALRISEMLMSSADTLSIHPKRHRGRKKDSCGRSLRFFPAGSYVMVYCVDDNARTVEVIRISHSRRDMNRLI